MNELLTWMGRNVEELTRDELLAALRQAAAELRAVRENARQTHRMYEEIAKFRRGDRRT